MKKRITASSIGRLGAGRYRADPTLYLRVMPSGSRQWLQRIVLPNGRQVDRGLGGWPVVGLEEARLTALSNRRAIRAGQDPFRSRKTETAPTFQIAADATLDANRSGWSAGTIKGWNNSIRHILPRLGSMRIASITRADVIDCLKSITSIHEARKAKIRITQVFELAISREWATENPAANGGLDAAIPALRNVKTVHHAAAPHAAVSGILARLMASSVAPSLIACLRFLVLTACRNQEAREAAWTEIDLDAKIWTIPAERMKTRKEHRVPLSDAAVELLRERQAVSGGQRYIFISERTGRPYSDESLRRLVRSDGCTIHGFRNSFRDWASEVAKVDREVAEHALAHVVGDQTERAYARSDLMDRRRELMQAWSDYVSRDV